MTFAPHAVENGLGAEGARVSDYLSLLKPRVMSLVVFTALVGLLVAPGNVHPLIAATAILAIAIGAGAAGALNMVLDADIDAVMSRTANRPIPRGRIESGEALGFGLVLAVFSVATMALAVNWAAAVLLAFTIFFYVVVYTLWLKRRTPQNIVIGGAAGAAPALVGWAAVTGSVGIGAWVLFLIVFYWTPPHFWALAVRYRDDYEKAGIPMLPVVAGVEATTRRMLLYTGLTVGVSLLLVPLGGMSWIYLVAALTLGAWMVWDTWRVVTHPERAMTLFTTSTVYLAALFGAVMLDALV